MLDPLTALSVAGTIVQFVDFSIKLVSEGHELYNSATGTSIGNAELGVIATDLQNLTCRLQQPPDSGTAEDEALHKLAKQCESVARELLLVLEKLENRGVANRRWKSYRQALKVLMRRDEVDAILLRLQCFRDEVNFHILVSMRDTLDMQAIKQTEGFRDLNEATRDLVYKLEKDQDQLREDLKAHREHLSHGQFGTNELITNEHEQTRKTILASIQSSLTVHSREKSRISSEDSDSSSDAIERERWKKRKKKQKERDDPQVDTLLLESLCFSTMRNRIEEIEPAHKKTYDWIFHPPAGESRWSDFPQWLSNGTGIYWINGKPASGKSTLMRFIHEHYQTIALLNQWSEPKQLIMATHFFWNSGTVHQRSCKGLLSALLFDILNQARSLIRLVFPERWAAGRWQSHNLFKDLESWTVPTLTKAFKNVFQLAGDDLRFCLFVDGLDEYDGDPFDIISIFTRLSKHSIVKMCLSSRPLYEFVKTFKSCPTLRLQDLNFGDIKQYVDDELGDNDLMRGLQRKEPEQAPQLVIEIIDKADGVFLWVRLVVLSLLRGLHNSDHISDLQKRLRLLPPTLEDLFSHILGRLDPVYLEQSSRIFQIFQAPRFTENRLTSLELSFAEDADAQSLLSSRTEPLSPTELASRTELVDIWLLTRCGGLIESNKSSNSDPFTIKLSYLHKTVRDFLELPQVWSRILEPTRGSGFNAHVSLMRSNILFIKLVLLLRSLRSHRSTHMIDLAFNSLAHAHQAELETGKAQVYLIDELYKMMALANRPGAGFWGRRKDDETQDDFFTVAIRYGLYHYVACKIACQPDIVRQKAGRPMLEYAIHKAGMGALFKLRLSSNMVDLLLRNGSDPNHIYQGSSAWRRILTALRIRCDTSWPVIGNNYESFELLKIIRLFVENGASIDDSDKRVLTCFMRHFPQETKELEAIMGAHAVLEENNRPR